jgi:hypothetical protein
MKVVLGITERKTKFEIKSQAGSMPSRGPLFKKKLVRTKIPTAPATINGKKEIR